MSKNYFLSFIFMIFMSQLQFSQKTTVQKLNSPITKDLTLIKNTTYLISEDLQLTNNAILNIQQGVELQSVHQPNVTIIINSGSKVVASGSYDNPIKVSSQVFTQEQPIIIMSSSTPKSSKLVTDHFYYQSITDPTIVVSPNPSMELDSKFAIR